MSGNLLVDATPTASTYTATLAPGKQYRWNVAACNATGCSLYTAPLYFQTAAVDAAVPSVPSGAAPGNAQEQGVLLPAAGLGSGEASIALRIGVFVPGQILENQRGGRSYVYMPQDLAERGDDYDIVRFREMIREA